MTTPVIICDDSSFARKQIARALPQDWDIEVTFANNGKEALRSLNAGKGKVMFLDLNMPVLDGYETLELMRKLGLSTKVIVVSGDIQPEAQQRVMQLGATEFIKKPVDATQINAILNKHGVIEERGAARQHIDVSIGDFDGYQEVANVAMGRAADLLARLLNEFVVMPIPNVNMIEVSELQMALSQLEHYDSISAVCQGFIGSGIAGEALLVFNESSFSDIASLMKYDGKLDETVELELLMDISNILIGACLNGIAEQLDVSFNQGHPTVLGRHVKVSDLLSRGQSQWKKTLTIEMGYTIKDRNINCDLLLLFTEDSIKPFNKLVSYLVD